jgi:ABC-type transport system substrate-binding protein
MKAIRLIESYLPIFNGFYNTHFEADEESMIEEGKTYDDYEWNYDDYKNRVAVACCEAIQKELKNLGIKVEFQTIQSPKYYNFSNDSINVAYHLEEDTYKNLYKYILENKDAFTTYIKENYSSYDGFMSFHSNDANDWLTYLIEEDKLSHRFGACLEFYLENEEYNVNDLLEDVCSETSYVSGELKENVK